jgi:FtsZ-binding cell division protein ZapB
VEVKFLQEYTQEVDLQVADGNLPPADTPFNVQGLAQVKNMLQREPTKFAKDDRAFFDAATAAKLQRDGIAEPVGEPLYSRQLRSFEYGLEDYQKKFETMSEDIQAVKSRLADLSLSLKNLQAQIDKHREELEQLGQDQQGFDAEREALRRYRDTLRQRYESLQEEVDSLAAR